MSGRVGQQSYIRTRLRARPVYAARPVCIPTAVMEQVFEYTIPVLHPLAVHLPLAILPLAALASVVWFVRDRLGWLKVAFWLTAVGAVGALAAVLSGDAMLAQSEGVPIVEQLGEIHEEWGQWTLWFAALTLVAFALTRWRHYSGTRHPGVPMPWRAVVAILSVALGIMVLWVGHVGGVMVWGVPH